MRFSARLRPTRSHATRQPTSSGATNYDAFVSYSHAADGQLAPALQAGLQGLGKPWYRRRVLRVFRDKTSLSASPELWPSIERALAASRYFILLASPEAAHSHWVDQEVRWWLEHRSPATMLVGLTGGTLAWDGARHAFDPARTTALPPAAFAWPGDEPLWVDLRWAREARHVSLRDPRFREAVADLAAPVRDLPKDELIGEDIRQHRRTLRLARSGIALLLALVVLAGVLGNLARIQRDDARSQRNEAQAQARLALSRQLGAQAGAVRNERLDVALLLGLEAVRRQDTTEAKTALLTALHSNHALVTSLPRNTQPLGPDKDYGDALTFSLDGQTLAWASAGGVAILSVQGQRRTVLPSTTGVHGLSISPDGRILAWSGKRGISLWDLKRDRADGEPLKASRGTLFANIAFSRDGTKMAGITDKLIMIWDVQRRVPIGRPLRLVPATAAQQPAIAVSADLKLAASATDGSAIVLWDIDQHRRLGQIEARYKEPVSGLAFSPDGTTLASVSGKPPSAEGLGGSVIIWDLATLRPKGRSTSTLRSYTSVAFSPDGRQVAAGFITTRDIRGIDGGIQILDAQRPTSSRVLRALGEGSDPLVFSRRGKLLASLEGTTVTVWSLASRDRLAIPLPKRGKETLGVALTRDGRSFAYSTRSFDSDFRASPLTETIVTPGHTHVLRERSRPEAGEDLGSSAVDFSRDGQLLAFLDSRRGLRTWHTRTRTVTSKPLLGVTAASFSPTSSLLAAGRLDGSVIMVDGGSGQPVEGYVIPGASLLNSDDQPPRVIELVFTGDGRRLLIGSSDGLVREVDVLSHRILSKSSVHVAQDDALPISSMHFSPDGRYVAYGTQSQGDLGIYGYMYVYDLAHKQLIISHSGATTSLRFSFDGKMLASAGVNGTLSLWDVRRRQLIEESLYHAGAISDMAYDANHQLMVGADGTAVLLRAGIAAWREVACYVFNRNLTQDEWNQYLGPAQPYVRTCPNLPAGTGAPANAPAAEYSR